MSSSLIDLPLPKCPLPPCIHNPSTLPLPSVVPQQRLLPQKQHGSGGDGIELAARIAAWKKAKRRGNTVAIAVVPQILSKERPRLSSRS